MHVHLLCRYIEFGSVLWPWPINLASKWPLQPKLLSHYAQSTCKITDIDIKITWVDSYEESGMGFSTIQWYQNEPPNSIFYPKYGVVSVISHIAMIFSSSILQLFCSAQWTYTIKSHYNDIILVLNVRFWCTYRGAELDSLREAFTIYTQILLSQALEPTFIGALVEEPGERFLVLMLEVMSLLLYGVQW